MKLKKITLTLATIALAGSLIGCSNDTNESSVAQEAAITSQVENTADVSLDWTGIYEGILPCADCSGIKTTLTLNANKTFELAQTYLTGKKEEKTEVATGGFHWVGEKPVIELDDKGTPIYYMITEGAAIKYDTEGNPIDSKLNYKLEQVTTFSVQ